MLHSCPQRNPATSGASPANDDREVPILQLHRAIRLAVQAVAALLALGVVASGIPLRAGPPAPAIRGLFVDDAHEPKVTISWPTRDRGKGRGRITLTGSRPYRSGPERTFLGRNLDCFVAAGGVRTTKGLTNPFGQVVRVGFYKADKGKPLFDDLADDAQITITLSGVRFNHPARPEPESVLLHAKFDARHVVEWGLKPNQVNLYTMRSKTDDLGGAVTPDVGRLGALRGNGSGSVDLRAEPDGSVSMTAHIPYRLLHHVRDPSPGTSPGSFVEPFHFHVEFESMPEPTGEKQDGPGSTPGRPTSQ